VISDTLTFSKLYVPTHPRLAAGFDFLNKLSEGIADGRYEIDGDRLFALVQSYTTTQVAARKLKHHRKYAEVQFLFVGEEIIEHVPLEGLAVYTPFDEAKDYGLVRDPSVRSAVILRPGAWAVFFRMMRTSPAALWVALGLCARWS
jgi:biofilm protein TabA